ncbi:MAG: type IV pilus assembly protein PilM [Patescibacteria group bacterium]|nr:type IV pilus assembly protein PilM [Patescibacteria group bacterium]
MTFKNYLAYLSEPRTFGVDINDNEIKVFEIEKNKEKHKIVGWNKRRLPKGIVEDCEILDKEKFSEVFFDAVGNSEGKKLKGKAVIVSIPENKVFLRIIKIPKMSEEELCEAIKWEVEANIPISASEVYYDWQIVDKGKKEMRVLVAASPRKVVDSLISTYEQIGYKVCVLEADSIATGRSVLSKKDKRPVLLVDIGIEGTGYFIFSGGYPVFSSGGSVSGNLFTDAVSKYYGLEWKKAEQYKMKMGLGTNKKEREDVFRVYSGLLSTLVQEIEKTINFYDENLSIDNEKVEKVVLCGGGSNLRGLLPYLAIHLKRQVVQGSPWENVHLGKEIPPISKEEAQSYITVIGLALRNCQNGYFN